MTGTDRFEVARSVADAVLYEGYVLYPYRASSRKNQVRFQWGVLTPRSFSEADGSERWSTRTECLVDPGVEPVVSVRVRCLHLQHRSVEAVSTNSGGFTPVDYLEIDGTLHVDWDEALDRVVDVPACVISGSPVSLEQNFSFPAGTEEEILRSADGTVVGRFVRRREPVHGIVRITTEQPDAGQRFVKVTVSVENTTEWSGDHMQRDDAMALSLVAVHTMLAVDDGRFVSLLDPPDDAALAASVCRGNGSYPVLIGDDDLVLASPIILYDHPEVASQSPGDLYDSLEIDEILALRVMTLTDEEKSEARGTDPRAAAIIDRCDAMSPETLSQLHGQMVPVPSAEPFAGPSARPAAGPSFASSSFDDELIVFSDEVPWLDPETDASYDPWTESVWIAGVKISKGSAVRLQPSHRADAHDMFLAGMRATVAGVFSDLDGEQHVAITVDDDPATEALQWQGRFLFFHPDEVVPLVDQEQAR
jgi:hypothetical protein